MKKCKLGKDGPLFSVLGMGTWAAGGEWQFGYGAADAAEMIRTIHFGLEAGINWLDTAPAYGLGFSEELVGKAVKGKRHELFIATKCGLLWNKHGKIRKELSPQTIRQELEKSLQRLQTDYIDLYQIHWPDSARSMETAWHALAKLQKQGKVRWIGLSNCNPELVQKLHTLHHVQSCQPMYNLLNRQVENDILPLCNEQDIGVVSYSPLHSGMLSEKFDSAHLPQSDWRRRDPAFNPPYLNAYRTFVEKLTPIAHDYGKSVSQFAVNWILQNPTITSTIIGIRSVEKLKHIVQGVGFETSQDDMQLVNLLTKTLPVVKNH